jgi:hypothetical protein
LVNGGGSPPLGFSLGRIASEQAFSLSLLPARALARIVERVRRFAWACLVLGLDLLGCQARSEPVDKPAPPDMSALVSAYQAPTAPLDQDTAEALWDAVHAVVDLLNRAGIDQALLDAIQAAVDAHVSGQRTQSTGSDVAQIRQRALDGDGYVRITRICNGWGPDPVPDAEANGQVELTAGFTETGFDPVIWGAFRRCKYRAGDELIELGSSEPDALGAFSAYQGEGVAFEQTGSRPMLFAFDVVATIGDRTERLASDFELDPSSPSFRFRVYVAGGYLLARAGRELVGVSATNGDFACSEATRACQSGAETVSF